MYIYVIFLHQRLATFYLYSTHQCLYTMLQKMVEMERRLGKVFGMRTLNKTNFKIVKISSKYLLLVFSEFADFIQLQVFFSIHFSKF